MANIQQNQAAWQPAAEAKQFQVGPGPDQTQPASDEVIVKVASVAINPSEWKMQDMAYLPLKYPHVLGSDCAGEVVKVGDGVTRFKLGDRVIGHCLGLVYGGARHGAFQNFTALRERVVARIPDSLAFERAVVLPLGLSTASTALFEGLGLHPPTSAAAELDGTKDNGQTVVIWGGSSSMGSTAIQLARAAGYHVVTTASVQNHAYVKSLGATQVFDHSAPDVVDAIVKALSKSTFAGICDCFGEEKTIRLCADILSRLGGGNLPAVLYPPTGLPDNVNASLVYASNPGTVDDHVGARIWKDFVPRALETGKLQAKPDPKVVGRGLDSIQGALLEQKKGVSAQKIVVDLQ